MSADTEKYALNPTPSLPMSASHLENFMDLNGSPSPKRTFRKMKSALFRRFNQEKEKEEIGGERPSTALPELTHQPLHDAEIKTSTALPPTKHSSLPMPSSPPPATWQPLGNHVCNLTLTLANGSYTSYDYFLVDNSYFYFKIKRRRKGNRKNDHKPDALEAIEW